MGHGQSRKGMGTKKNIAGGSIGHMKPSSSAEDGLVGDTFAILPSGEDPLPPRHDGVTGANHAPARPHKHASSRTHLPSSRNSRDPDSDPDADDPDLLARDASHIRLAADDVDVDMDEEEDDDEEEEESAEADADADDRKYCTCRSVSYGNMVACDNDDCPYEWFHWQCVGMTKEPIGKWYCEECRVKLGIRE